MARSLVIVITFLATLVRYAGAQSAGNKPADVEGAPVGGELDAKPTKTIIRAADGLSIVCETHGRGDTALFFLHGWCGDRGWWKHQVNAFAHEYQVIAIDQAGHGESGKDREEWSVDGLAADVRAVVKDLGLKRVILVGHSMGGPVSLAAAKRMPGTVVAVIGVDTLHNAEHKTPEDQAKKFLGALETDFKGTLPMFLRGMLPEKVDPELLEWLSTRAKGQDPKIAVAIMRALSRVDARPLFEDAKVPIRCINSAPGTAQFAMKTESEVNKKYADFNVVTMEEVGHFPMLERPVEFNQRLRDVLKEFALRK